MPAGDVVDILCSRKNSYSASTPTKNIHPHFIVTWISKYQHLKRDLNIYVNNIPLESLKRSRRKDIFAQFLLIRQEGKIRQRDKLARVLPSKQTIPRSGCAVTESRTHARETIYRTGSGSDVAPCTRRRVS